MRLSIGMGQEEVECLLEVPGLFVGFDEEPAGRDEGQERGRIFCGEGTGTDGEEGSQAGEVFNEFLRTVPAVDQKPLRAVPAQGVKQASPCLDAMQGEYSVVLDCHPDVGVEEAGLRFHLGMGFGCFVQACFTDARMGEFVEQGREFLFPIDGGIVKMPGVYPE